jgi:flagellar basal-body rod modification protein FlgD
MASAIDSILQGSATTAASSAVTTASQSEDVLGREDFLTLLVAQLQNQDPLSPEDPTQFTAQLAQFSSLEQLFNLNDTMETLATAFNNSDRLGTLNTIGKEVSFQSSSFSFDGEPLDLGYQLDAQAANVTIALRNNGNTVAILEGKDLSQGTHFLSWDGKAANGEPAPSGNYTMTVQAANAQGESISASSLIRSQVTGVDLQGENGGTLITRTGEISFNSILGVFEPSSPAKTGTSQENT